MLNKYTDALKTEGEYDSTGEFRIAREKALVKLAGYSLPFQGAWALKVIQAVVSSGSKEAIDIRQLRDRTEFRFQLEETLSPDQVEQAFYDIEKVVPKSLQHLRVALWAVGVGEERGFELCLGGTEQLKWTGRQLLRTQISKPQQNGRLTVAHPGSGCSWLQKQIARRKENSAILRTVAERCFVCPIPLKLDSRRMDVLQYCPDRGWNRDSIPFLLGFGESQLPGIGVPGGTYEEVKLRSVRGPLYKDAKTLSLSASDSDYYTETSVMYLIGLSGKAQWGRDVDFPIKFLPQKSECYWVADGVIVDRDEFKTTQTPFSASVFLNSEGMESDATTLSLRRSPERKRRMRSAAHVINDGLAQFPYERFTTINSKQGKRASRDFLLTALGIGAIAANGPILAPLAPLLVGSGLSFFSNALSHQQSDAFRKKIGSHYRDFQESWRVLAAKGKR